MFDLVASVHPLRHHSLWMEQNGLALVLSGDRFVLEPGKILDHLDELGDHLENAAFVQVGKLRQIIVIEDDAGEEFRVVLLPAPPEFLQPRMDDFIRPIQCLETGVHTERRFEVCFEREQISQLPKRCWIIGIECKDR